MEKPRTLLILRRSLQQSRQSLVEDLVLLGWCEGAGFKLLYVMGEQH